MSTPALADDARKLARQNIDALLDGGFDAIITNAAGCGSTLKEYGELLEHDPAYAEKARRFAPQVKDVTEFLASIELNTEMDAPAMVATYQDSCHLAHGQKIRSAPRKLLNSVPGLELREMQLSDMCCGSAGIYNVLHTNMALALLRKKMDAVNATGAQCIVTANPAACCSSRPAHGRFGQGQKVAHVVEVLDRAYRVKQDSNRRILNLHRKYRAAAGPVGGRYFSAVLLDDRLHHVQPQARDDRFRRHALLKNPGEQLGSDSRTVVAHHDLEAARLDADILGTGLRRVQETDSPARAPTAAGSPLSRNSGSISRANPIFGRLAHSR